MQLDIALLQIVVTAEHLSVGQSGMSAFAPGDLMIRVHFLGSATRIPKLT